jgi:ectoine hydroxylase-related dioxygenase (phytanoyl-CoA dioxygenase family)
MVSSTTVTIPKDTISNEPMATVQEEQPSPPHYPVEMTEDERYLFDLQGFVIVRNVLTPDQVAAANAAIDRHAQCMVRRSDGPLRNVADASSRMYGTGPGRLDLGGMLEWDAPDATVFQSILAHPRLVPLFHGLLGKGYHLDHLPLCIAQDEGAEGFSLHGGTIDCDSGEYNPHLAYHCHASTIRTALLGCNVVLTDHNKGDGGFCIVPGSHKSHFKMPPGLVDGTTPYADTILQQPVTKAGDVILFSEGTVHGALPWTPADRQRRVCLYRFAPATNVYGRSYFGHEGSTATPDGRLSMGWPPKMYRGLTDAQRAVLEPPYANRLDRPNIQPDGSVVITTRNERKKQHDRDVFGTPYF